MKKKPSDSLITVRLRRSGARPGTYTYKKTKMDLTPKGATQRQRWFADGWDEICLYSGDSWTSLFPSNSLITRATPEKPAPVKISPASLLMITKDYEDTTNQAKSLAKKLSEALFKTMRDVTGEIPEGDSLSTIASNLETAQARARTLREILILLGFE